MHELSKLALRDLVLPTPAYIFGAIVFGIAGYAAFRRGRKTANRQLTWTGVVLMLYPYAVSQTWLLWMTGMVLCGWVFIKWA